jgi:hypothetical protein
MARVAQSPFKNVVGEVFQASSRAQMGWMWTKEHGARQAGFERRRYPTDLTDQEWQIIRPPAAVRQRLRQAAWC